MNRVRAFLPRNSYLAKAYPPSEQKKICKTVVQVAYTVELSTYSQKYTGPVRLARALNNSRKLLRFSVLPDHSLIGGRKMYSLRTERSLNTAASSQVKGASTTTAPKPSSVQRAKRDAVSLRPSKRSAINATNSASSKICKTFIPANPPRRCDPA